MKRIIGLVMVATPFIAIAVAGVIANGFWPTLAIFASVGALAIWLMVAAELVA